MLKEVTKAIEIELTIYHLISCCIIAMAGERSDLHLGRSGLISTSDESTYVASVRFNGESRSLELCLMDPDLETFSAVLSADCTNSRVPVAPGAPSLLEQAGTFLVSLMSESGDAAVADVAGTRGGLTLKVLKEADARVVQILTSGGTNLLTSRARLLRAASSSRTSAGSSSAGSSTAASSPWSMIQQLVAQEARARSDAVGLQRKLDE